MPVEEGVPFWRRPSELGRSLDRERRNPAPRPRPVSVATADRPVTEKRDDSDSGYAYLSEHTRRRRLSELLDRDSLDELERTLEVYGRRIHFDPAAQPFLRLTSQSVDPADPPDGESYIWLSDGTGSGDAGDVLIKSTVSGTTKTAILLPYVREGWIAPSYALDDRPTCTPYQGCYPDIEMQFLQECALPYQQPSYEYEGFSLFSYCQSPLLSLYSLQKYLPFQEELVSLVRDLLQSALYLQTFLESKIL